jgi:hypothetical protein
MFDEVDIIGVEPRLEVLGMKYAMLAHPISFFTVESDGLFRTERCDLLGGPLQSPIGGFMVQPYLALHCMVHRNDTDHVLPPATVTQFQDTLDKLQPAYLVFNNTNS